jgi:hypothetical protein
VIDDLTLVRRRAVLTEVLDAPVAELTMSDEVNVLDNFVNSGALLFLNTVLEDVLDNQTASLAQSNLMPHSTKCLIDLEHDLRRLPTPAELEQLLPHMTSIAVNDSVRNASKQFPNHISLVVLWNRVEGLLDDVATERIHAESDDVAVNGISNGDDLLRSAVLEAALNQEVAEAVDHERVCLVDDGVDNVIFLVGSADFEFLLQEDGGLLVVAADDLIDNVLPITRD